MGNQIKRKLRVGLLLDSYMVPAWVHLMLERTRSGNYAELVLVVLNNSYSEPAKPPVTERLVRNWHRLPEGLVSRFLNRLRRELMERRPVTNSAHRRTDAGPLLKDVATLRIIPECGTFTDAFSESDLEKVGHFELDVVVRIGFRILRGGILNAARHGVWSYHHGDNRINRGGPPGYWEVMESWPETGAVLQILNEDLDGGTVLCRSWSSTNRKSVAQNNNARYWTSASFVPRMLQRLYSIGNEQFLEEIQKENGDLQFYCERLYSSPSNVDLFQSLCRKALEKIRSRLQFQFYFDQWVLLYAFGKDIPRSLRKYKLIVPPKDRFWADPFALYRNNRHYIFMEELTYDDDIGCISLLELDREGNHGLPVRIISEPHHLSYPFLFEANGTLYMLAEAYGARVVPLYRCEEFPHKWVFEKNLMEDIAGVDPTLHYQDGTWYLFMNVVENPGASEWDELFIYMSDDPINGEWHPHPRNPVVSDVKIARPAGRMFKRGNELYRPSQDCSRHYGYALNLNRVSVLDRLRFEEELTTKIVPNWDPRIRSVHTFSTANGLTVMDAQLYRPRYW